MGMVLVMSLVEQIDATISLDRTGGTTFTVRVPASLVGHFTVHDSHDTRTLRISSGGITKMFSESTTMSASFPASRSFPSGVPQMKHTHC